MDYKANIELLMKKQVEISNELQKLLEYKSADASVSEEPSIVSDIKDQPEVKKSSPTDLTKEEPSIAKIEDQPKAKKSSPTDLPREEPSIPKVEDQPKVKKSSPTDLPKEEPSIPKKEDQPKAKKSSPTDLPKINVPEFSGEAIDWLEFRSRYCGLVHSNAVLSNSQKFEHLKSALPNEVFDFIKHLFDPRKKIRTGYSAAWKILEEKFNRRTLVDVYLTKLTEQSSKKISSGNIDQIANETQKCLQGLQTLKVDAKTWDILLIHLFVQELDEETKIKWKEASCSKMPKLDKFFEFLKSKIVE